jgi:hypothetical protein
MKSAIELIKEERTRQIQEEGWSADHDDKHTDGGLAAAACVYADFANYSGEFDLVDSSGKADVMIPRDFKWPFDKESFKPTPDDRIRELVKAGALIVAEIERIRRIKDENA